FEPRYRQMTADALAGDRLIGLTLLQPGWEDEYEGRPAVHSVACLGRVVADQLLPDGRYNLLLPRISPLRLLHQAPHQRPRPTAPGGTASRRAPPDARRSETPAPGARRASAASLRRHWPRAGAVAGAVRRRIAARRLVRHPQLRPAPAGRAQAGTLRVARR